MLNIRTKYIVLSCNIVWINKTYGDYVSIKDHTKGNKYILQYEDKLDKWSYVKINTVKTEDMKTKQNFSTKYDSRGEEDTQNNINVDRTLSIATRLPQAWCLTRVDDV